MEGNFLNVVLVYHMSGLVREPISLCYLAAASLNNSEYSHEQNDGEVTVTICECRYRK